MKKLILTLLLLAMCAVVYAVQPYATEVIAVYKLNGNVEDDSGFSDDLYSVGTGATFVTDYVNTNAYSMKWVSGANYFRFPQTLCTYLASLGNGGKFSLRAGFKYTAFSGGNEWKPILVSGRYSISGGEIGQYFGYEPIVIGLSYERRILGWNNLDMYAANFAEGLNTDWHTVNIEYDNGTLKHYLDGTLVSSNTGRTNPYINMTPTYNTSIGYAPYFSEGDTKIRFEEVYVYGGLLLGQGVTPLPNETATVTETITDTATPTVTQTVTPTITMTNTSTATPTVTQTVTSTITPTYTMTPVPYANIPTPEISLTLQQYAFTNSHIVVRWHNEKWTSEYSLWLDGDEHKLYFPYDRKKLWWYYNLSSNFSTVQLSADYRGNTIYSRTLTTP